MRGRTLMGRAVGPVKYFKDLAAETGVPYQVLINLYLKECVTQKKRLAFAAKSALVRKKAA